MIMTRLEKAIKYVKETQNGAWIYDDNGNIRENVAVCEIEPLLEEMKEYEIEKDDEFIKEFKAKAESYYTYNYSTNIEKDIIVWYIPHSPIIVCQVHLYGDARLMFDTDFVLEMPSEDGFDEFLYLENTRQTKSIGDYDLDMSIFSETYEIYKDGEYVGTSYEIDFNDYLEELEEQK